VGVFVVWWCCNIDIYFAHSCRPFKPMHGGGELWRRATGPATVSRGTPNGTSIFTSRGSCSDAPVVFRL
jgi:hypothetical protein